MSQIPALPATLLLVATLLAGCHGEEPPPDDSPIEGPEAEVSSVEVIEAPERAAPGTEIMVCWELEGRGTIPHTAVHYDNETHPDPTTFDLYSAGVAWPENETRQRDEGYEVPFVYCSTIPMGNETIYYRAHAMVEGPPGVLGDERRVDPET